MLLHHPLSIFVHKSNVATTGCLLTRYRRGKEILIVRGVLLLGLGRKEELDALLI